MFAKQCVPQGICFEYSALRQMEEIKSHYCLAGESHFDGCDCNCSTCEDRNKFLKQEAFNKKLNEKLKEVFNDSEFI